MLRKERTKSTYILTICYFFFLNFFCLAYYIHILSHIGFIIIIIF